MSLEDRSRPIILEPLAIKKIEITDDEENPLYIIHFKPQKPDPQINKLKAWIEARLLEAGPLMDRRVAEILGYTPYERRLPSGSQYILCDPDGNPVKTANWVCHPNTVWIDTPAFSTDKHAWFEIVEFLQEYHLEMFIRINYEDRNFIQVELFNTSLPINHPNHAYRIDGNKGYNTIQEALCRILILYADTTAGVGG